MPCSFNDQCPVKLGWCSSASPGKVLIMVATLSTGGTSYSSHTAPGRGPRFMPWESQLTVVITLSDLISGRRSFVKLQSIMEITHCRHTLSPSQLLLVQQQLSPSPAHGVWILRTAHPQLVGGFICIEVGRQGLTSTSRSISKHPGRKIPSLLWVLTSSSGASPC